MYMELRLYIYTWVRERVCAAMWLTTETVYSPRYVQTPELFK